jgi:hypothetical protein
MSDMDLANEAITELLRLGRENHVYDFAMIFETLKKNNITSAVAPTINFLLHVPIKDGGAGSSLVEKPDTREIRAAVDFLKSMGDEKAIPALTRIANTHRTIRIAAQYDEWEKEPNNDERAEAERAIQAIKGRS